MPGTWLMPRMLEPPLNVVTVGLGVLGVLGVMGVVGIVGVVGVMGVMSVMGVAGTTDVPGVEDVDDKMGVEVAELDVEVSELSVTTPSALVLVSDSLEVPLTSTVELLALVLVVAVNH